MLLQPRLTNDEVESFGVLTHPKVSTVQVFMVLKDAYKIVKAEIIL